MLRADDARVPPELWLAMAAGRCRRALPAATVAGSTPCFATSGLITGAPRCFARMAELAPLMPKDIMRKYRLATLIPGDAHSWHGCTYGQADSAPVAQHRRRRQNRGIPLMQREHPFLYRKPPCPARPVINFNAPLDKSPREAAHRFRNPASCNATNVPVVGAVAHGEVEAKPESDRGPEQIQPGGQAPVRMTNAAMHEGKEYIRFREARGGRRCGWRK